ncbi:MATE family efflux transporter [Treponema zioleckii]|uniref:MATE family efflux transporter n=1 Tax=Treponema zioleckii TaxID=331680 RepID=UPI00168BC623|nr:MATE family efflux transporter [Treponema zioleckii]
MKNLKAFLHPDLTGGQILPSLLSFALPIIISLVFQHLYNAVDTIIVGHYLAEDSLAAIGASAPLFELLVGFGNGFSNGLSIVAARAYGSGNRDSLKKVVASSIILTAGVTVLITFISRVSLLPALGLLKTPSNIINEAFSYINTITMFAVVLFAFNFLSGMLRATGDSFSPLIFLIISSVLNIFLDVLFITKFGMGIRGAAVATVVAQGISALLCLFFIAGKARILIPSARHFKMEPKMVRELFGQGISMALMSALVSSGTVILQSAINTFGTKVIAGHLASRKIFSILCIPLIALGTASSTFVSQNLGAGKLERIRRGIFLSIFMSSAWALFLVLLMKFAVHPLLSFISGSDDEILLEYGTKYLFFCIPFFIVLGSLVISRNCLQGLGSKVLPLISSVIELCGKIAFTKFIVPALGTWGIILCEPLIWCVMCAQLLFVLLRHPAVRRTNSPKWR